ncbi:hypothetical protein SCP_0114230 [Sparassis crispa]|uniref:Uncharacterized protein n=1 Tax=Sparassis crispa TaxID=139825 RepID=A0A401G8N9_9APHY|nr:hypothetical protein SCP_0114230 [Sparassis crispa]GBE78534.1 hypothetical protein SCP_0114230 [Sparassis crispa]
MPSHPSKPLPSSRLTPFSLQEFNDLVCAAFNLHSPQRRLALSSTSPYIRDSLYHASSPALLSVSSCFESDTEDEDGDTTHPPPAVHSRTPSARSSSYTASPSSSPRRKPRSSSSARAALNVFKRVRTRASALVLRSTNLNTPRPSTAASASESSTRTVRPHRPSSTVFQSRPSTPSTRPTSPFPFGPSIPSSTLTGPSPAEVHASFIKLSPRRVPLRPYIAGSAAIESLPSFFEDTGYARARTPSYSRPATPLLRGAGLLPLRIHSRLPPLRKMKSTSLFGRATATLGANSGRKTALSSPPVPWTQEDASADHAGRCPSPYTCPRDPPPVPVPVCASSSVAGRQEREEEEIQPPAYVFERRGSATSTCTTASTKSTMSLSERLVNLIPLPLRPRSRSKLNLSILSADSSPAGSASSTRSTDTWSPVTPTGVFAFPPVPESYEPTLYGSRTSLATVDPELNILEDEDLYALSIGRVLTPEPDPFAKGDIALPSHALGFNFDATPRAIIPPADPFSSPGTWTRPWMRDSHAYIHEPWASDVDADARGRASWNARLSSALPPDPAYSFPLRSPSPPYTFPSPVPAPRSLRHNLSIRTSATGALPPSAWSPCSSAFSTSSASSSSASIRSRGSADIRSVSIPRSPSVSSLARSLPGSPLDAAFSVAPLPPPHRPLPDIPRTESPPPVPPKDVSVGRKEAHRVDHIDTSPSRASKIRASLPASPPESPVSPRSRASLPVPMSPRSWVSSSSRSSRRSERPPSPFPLMRALTHGSESRASPRRGSAGGKSLANPASCAVQEDEVKGWHDTELSVEDRSGVLSPLSGASSGLPMHAPNSLAGSTATLNAAAMIHPGLSALSSANGPDSLQANPESNPLSVQSLLRHAHNRYSSTTDTEGDDSDSWDHGTMHTARTTVSSMFYSARSSMKSVDTEGGSL